MGEVLHLRLHKLSGEAEQVTIPSAASGRDLVRMARSLLGVSHAQVLKLLSGSSPVDGNRTLKDQGLVAGACLTLTLTAVLLDTTDPWRERVMHQGGAGLEGDDWQVWEGLESLHFDGLCQRNLQDVDFPPGLKSLTFGHTFMQAEVREVAVKAVKSLGDGVAGIFGVELFVFRDGSVTLNEVAPRPHNSGHYTIEACGCDQFEAHVRAVMGLPLPEDTDLRVGAALMINVVSQVDEPGTGTPGREFARLCSVSGAVGHWYGKAASKKGRKMAHVTVCAPSPSALTERLGPVADLVGIGMPKPGALVGVIMGSDSDLPCMKECCDALKEFGVPYECTVVSAHRTPDRMVKYARSAAGRGLRLIVAGAGGAAHLPGMVAALTPLPVIGVPVKTSALSGVDSLYSIVQMPKGVPVATVAIGNARNAGLLAVRMLAGCGGDPQLLARMAKFQDDAREEVEEKAAALEEAGETAYLANSGKKSATVM